MATPSRMAADTNPLWSPNWFYPGHQPFRAGASTPAVEVIEERKDGEGVVITIVTRNNT